MFTLTQTVRTLKCLDAPDDKITTIINDACKRQCLSMPEWQTLYIHSFPAKRPN